MEFVFVDRNPNDFKKLMRGAQQFGISIPQLRMRSVGALTVEATLRQRDEDCTHICVPLNWVG